MWNQWHEQFESNMYLFDQRRLSPTHSPAINFRGKDKPWFLFVKTFYQKCLHEWQHTNVGFEMWCLWYDSSWKIIHTTCEGCTKYILESLLDTIMKCSEGNALIREMELLHYTLHFEWSRNSERDYPQSAGRNVWLMSHSKVSGSERRGNLLHLLCLSHTDSIKPRFCE